MFGFDADLPHPTGPSIIIPNPGGDIIGQPFIVSAVRFYSDANRTTLIDTYSTPTLLGSGTTFFGLKDTVPFQSLAFDTAVANPGGGFSPYIDDFQVGRVIPEPTSASLLLLGAIGLSVLTLRHRR